jgi:flagellar protein FlaG
MSDTIAPVAMSIPADAVSQQPGSDGHFSSVAKYHNTEAADPGKISAIVERLNTSLQSLGTKVSFAVDHQTKDIVITVLNSTTGEVIRQIPPEAMLRVSEHIQELLGVLFDAAG